MKITIIGLGSRGDIQPLVPLGQALQSAGHKVCVATFSAFAPLVIEAGLGYHPIRGDAQALVRAAGRGMLDGRQNPWTALRAIQRSYGRLAASIAEDLSNPALGDAELILNQLPGNLFGADLAERRGIPAIRLAVIPLEPTHAWPMHGFPPWPARLPGYNLLTYRLAERMVWVMFRQHVNRWRKDALGLPPRPLTGGLDAGPTPVVNGFSEWAVPRPREWGPHVHITGWWLPHDEGWEPPAALSRFLDDGPPPVFIGFGSMPAADPEALTTTIVAAVRSSGRRAVLHAGWAGLGGRLPPEIHPITYAPYRWLFPRMAAIIHHGGSGTAGFAFTAGVPSAVVPFAFDQFFWGRRAAELGVGPPPLPYRRLTAAKLAATIDAAASDGGMRRRAAELGARLRAEDGPRRAAEVIAGLI